MADEFTPEFLQAVMAHHNSSIDSFKLLFEEFGAQDAKLKKMALDADGARKAHEKVMRKIHNEIESNRKSHADLVSRSADQLYTTLRLEKKILMKSYNKARLATARRLKAEDALDGDAGQGNGPDPDDHLFGTGEEFLRPAMVPRTPSTPPDQAVPAPAVVPTDNNSTMHCSQTIQPANQATAPMVFCPKPPREIILSAASSATTLSGGSGDSILGESVSETESRSSRWTKIAKIPHTRSD